MKTPALQAVWGELPGVPTIESSKPQRVTTVRRYHNYDKLVQGCQCLLRVFVA